jgi:hypothetical protein
LGASTAGETAGTPGSPGSPVTSYDMGEQNVYNNQWLYI